MTRLLGTALLLCFASGCLVRTAPETRTRTVVVVKEKACHPSQYWDGTECRHKGNGHGARKHDER